MQHYKIMNILLSDSPQFLGCPLLLCRADRPFRRIDQEAWLFDGPGTYDFMTFFNGISISKWKQYTVAKRFGLHLEVKGAACSIVQTRADSFSWYAEEILNTELSVPASNDWITVDVELDANDADAVESFIVRSEGQICIRRGYYYALVDDSDIRSVELALCTTTFKKEEYIKRNIDLIKTEIFGTDNAISDHFHMHVIDNGRTLNIAELEGQGVSIHPNPNVGGAGGFARGMIEALEQSPKATHVLLMDDDVLVSSESIIRTFNLCALANDEYKDAFISGAMMNMDEPNLRWEEMGFMSKEGYCKSLKPIARMDVLHDVVDNETFDIPSYMPGCEDQEQHYAAWWYCTIPVSQIEQHGLPMPIFVRFDDVEYSLRCKPKFVTMNGICIWHLSFFMRYNAAQERYQTARNSLINQFASAFAPLSHFEGMIDEMFNSELSKFNYTDAELVLDGFEDFLKGPDWIMQPNAEGAFLGANKRSEQLVSIEEIVDQAAELGVDLSGITTWKVSRDLPLNRIQKLAFEGTKNGNIKLPLVAFMRKGDVAVIDRGGWAYPKGKLQGVKAVIAIDLQNRKGIVRHSDQERSAVLIERYKKDLALYKADKGKLGREYKAAFPQMTSKDFWKKYLLKASTQS